jgi:histidinol-phosphate aminotransferase
MFRPNVLALHPYVPGEQPQGGKFIKLNTNENPYPPPQAAVDAICHAAQGGLQRYPDPLATAFRRRAAEVLGVSPDWIIAGNGSDEILTILVRALVAEGGLLRLPFPSYILYRTLADIQAARWQQVHWDDGWQLPIDRLAAPDPQLQLVLVPNPNSPSGTIVSHDSLVQLADRLPCPLVVDEAYVDFAPQTAIELVKRHERIIVTRTLSKSYALAGLRFGYAVAQPQVIAELMKIKDSYNCDALSIAGATAAIDAQQWLQQNVDKVVTTRKRLGDGLTQRGFIVTPSHANFVWCTRPNTDHRWLYEQFKAHQILIRYMKFEGWGDGIRISVGTDDQIDALLLMLDRILANEATVLH